jgi:SPP1 family predicted phage head-tail adaptor
MSEYTVNISDLDKRITFQKFTVDTNENGFPIEDWMYYKKVWASMNNLFGKEFYSAKAVQSEKTIEFVMRYSKDLEVLLDENSTNLYRIFWNNRVFDITFVDDIKYQHEWLKIKAMVSE